MVSTTDASRSTTLLPALPTATRGWRAACVAPVFGGFQGGAMAATGRAAVIDLMVTDHKYSTRLGPSACSPPV